MRILGGEDDWHVTAGRSPRSSLSQSLEAASMSPAEPRLYHETQVASLCGVHAINTLLQGPYFSEVDLGQARPAPDQAQQNESAGRQASPTRAADSH